MNIAVRAAVGLISRTAVVIRRNDCCVCHAFDPVLLGKPHVEYLICAHSNM